jgi:hypothetical protein
VLVAAAVVLGTWWAALLLVLLVDPLNLYSWGVAPRLAKSDYAPEAAPYLVSVVANDPAIDTVLIGGSTSVAFRRDLLEEMLPGTQDAFNVSYRAVRAGDRELVSERLLESRSIRRVLIAVDWIYGLKGPLSSEPSFPSYLYDASPLNDVRMVGPNTVSLAIDAVSRHAVWLSDWNWPAYEASRKKLYSRFQTPQEMERLRKAIERHRAEVATPSQLDCANLDAVNRQLLPFVRELSARGIQVDLFFPPYSYVVYYDWLATPERRVLVGPAFLEDQLLMRRCLVDAASVVPHTRRIRIRRPGMAGRRSAELLRHDASLERSGLPIHAATDRRGHPSTDPRQYTERSSAIAAASRALRVQELQFRGCRWAQALRRIRSSPGWCNTSWRAFRSTAITSSGVSPTATRRNSCSTTAWPVTSSVLPTARSSGSATITAGSAARSSTRSSTSAGPGSIASRASSRRSRRSTATPNT